MIGLTDNNWRGNLKHGTIIQQNRLKKKQKKKKRNKESLLNVGEVKEQ